MSTQRAPKGLFQSDQANGSGDSYVDVPPDDYRAIRRAILDLREFDMEKLNERLAGKSLPAGPIATAFEYDVSFSKLLSVFLHDRPIRRRKNSQLELFSSDDENNEKK